MIIAVPNDCVGLIIGKGGDTIRHLQQKSGCKIQVAKREIPNSSLRNVFIEGLNPERFEISRVLIQQIVHEHLKITESLKALGCQELNPFPRPHVPYAIDCLISDVVIGENGQCIKQLFQKTNCYIYVPLSQINNERIFELSGSPDSIERCKAEIYHIA